MLLARICLNSLRCPVPLAPSPLTKAVRAAVELSLRAAALPECTSLTGRFLLVGYVALEPGDAGEAPYTATYFRIRTPKYQAGGCDGLNCAPFFPNSCIEVLTPSSSEWDCIWR